MKLDEVIIDDDEPKRRKTKTKEKPAVSDDILKQKHGDLTKHDSAEVNKDKAPETDANPRRTASKAETDRRMKGVEMPGNAPHINTDGLEDHISDAEAARIAGVDTTTPNLPKVISTAVAKLGTDLARIDPKGIAWHQVKNLPGYLQSPIRAIGRQVFSPFTKTPIEDIQVIANIGSGPNSKAEMAAYASILKQHGKRDRSMEIEFHDRIPGYGAEIVIYKWLGYTFLMVKDFAGVYCYSWSSKDDKHVPKGDEKRLK